MKKFIFLCCIFINFTLNAQTYITNCDSTEISTGYDEPIAAPLQSFKAHYVSQWGATNRNTGAGWPILNDESTPLGTGSMGADGPPAGIDWATIRGGFNSPVKIPTDSAFIISGKIEWVGGGCGDSYIPIRYALTYQDSDNVLNYQYTDSARWSSTSGSYGWEFTPMTGTSYMPGGIGGSGTVWIVNNGAWSSTYINNGYPISQAEQLPLYAEIVEGVYNFMISVEALSDTSAQISWYLIHEDGVSYWWGGTAVDTLITNQFNGICFGLSGEHLTDIKQLNIMDVYVELDILFVEAIEENTSDLIPKAHFLGQNYPNPFNPKTVISYTLPVSGHINLSIYNIIGQKIATLVSENKQSGNYTITWDAAQMVSGFYYYRLTAGDFVSTRKMLLLK